MQVRLENSCSLLTLEDQPLGGGGEGTIHAVTDPPEFRHLVAKLYKTPTPQQADKLAAMIAHPPRDPMAHKGHVSIAWPVARVLAVEDDRFLGYLMPRVEHARPIHHFYNPKARREHSLWWVNHKFLVIVAGNLASTVAAVHEAGYVIGDLCEANILVSSKALVTLVDTDSFQVRDPDHGAVYRCPVGKPEYTPPELQGLDFADVDRCPEHDRFGLGVLVFRLVMQGVHPFHGRYVGEDDPPELEARIAAGHWPYTRQGPVPWEPSPKAPPWDILPPRMHDLLHRCFDEGHTNPAGRPHATHWQSALIAARKELDQACPNNRRHVYPQRLDFLSLV